MLNRLHFNLEEFTIPQKEAIFNQISKEVDNIGYYNLPNQNINHLLEYSKSFDKDVRDIIVVGIGGSSLGAKAVYNFLKPVKDFKKGLHFLESTDPLNISDTLKSIDLKKSHIIVISKSGTTVETIAIFKYLLSKIDNPNNYTFITDKGSKLDSFAKSFGSKVFYLPTNVGGRFSVLSVVGLLPLLLVGVDINALLNGAKEIKESFFNDGYIKNTLIKKALFFAKYHTRYNINVLFAYTETLRYFLEWYVQLWAESLGKQQKNSIFNVGVTPIGLVGPKDQHSFLQLIVEGTRDKTVTFIKIKDFQNELKIPDITLKELEDLDILNNITFHDLITMQSNSVIEALLNKKDIPIDEIEIDRVDEKSIGNLIYYFELLTSLMGQLIDVNTYNQPGVEEGKIILKQKLKDFK